MLKILCFGDSITLGEKDLEQGGWADRLKTKYLRQYNNHQNQQVIVYNLGIGGETTDGLLRRFETEFNARKINGQKTLVLFSYGANDIVLHKSKNIVPQQYFERNLKKCIGYAIANQSQIILLSVLPISNDIEGIINQHGKIRFENDIKLYNQCLENIAIEMQCLFVDLYEVFNVSDKVKLLSDDGVHPNSKGHQLIFELIEQSILKVKF